MAQITIAPTYIWALWKVSNLRRLYSTRPVGYATGKMNLLKPRWSPCVARDNFPSAEEEEAVRVEEERSAIGGGGGGERSSSKVQQEKGRKSDIVRHGH